MASIMTSQTTIRSQTQHIDKDYQDWRDTIPPQWKRYYNEYTPPKKGKYIQFLPIYGLGNFYQKQEGQAPAFDSLSEGIPFFTSFSTYALACQITKEQYLEDPINLFAKVPKALSKSAADTFDKIVVGMHNFAFAGGRLMADGQPLCSANHILGPVMSSQGLQSVSGQPLYSNYLGNAQLTVENLTQGEMLMENLPDARGLKSKRTLRKLIISSNSVMKQIAQEVLGTPTAPHENSRTINTQYNGYELMINRDLTNPYAWFLQANEGEPGEDAHCLTVWIRWMDGGKHGLHRFQDQMTENYVVIASFRLAIGAFDWPGIVGSLGGGPVVG